MPCPGRLGPQEEVQSAGPVTAVQGPWTEIGPRHVAALPTLGQPVSATHVEAWSGAATREAGHRHAVRTPSSTREGRRCPTSPTGRP